MAFTTPTITHHFQNANGTAASGSVVFTLTKRMTNGTTTVVPGTPITATLDGSGDLSQTVVANGDVGSIPSDARWQVDLKIAGAPEDQFYITVPSGSGSVDLGSLLPQDALGG